MSRINSRGKHISSINPVKAFFPCCQQVRRTLASTSCVPAPSRAQRIQAIIMRGLRSHTATAEKDSFTRLTAL